MKIRFLGAARAVTGSLHVLEVAGKRIALDCGLVQGHRAEARAANATLKVDPLSLDAVILSHAHVDHSGNLPTLVKKGFRGLIHATPATCDLARILLRDSAHIQEVEAQYMAQHAAKRRARGFAGTIAEPVPPLYGVDDVPPAVERFRPHAYHESFEVVPGVRATFYDAGHILGSAVTVLTWEEDGVERRLGYTGDLGRPNHPIIRDPERIPVPLDALICESTYGDRIHEARTDLEHKLADTLRRAFERGGRVIVPAFSIGRTQNLVYALHQLLHRGELQPIPIYVDSPLSVDATEIYRAHPECYDDETRHWLEANNDSDPFGFKLLTYIKDVEESKALNDRPGPCVIISASGTCEHGRILHHLKNNIYKPETTIVFTGFQPRDTLGRKLVEGERHVQIFGERHKVRAEIVKLNGFSAHADREELSVWVKNLEGLREVFVVHGEERAALALADHLTALGIGKVRVPFPGDEVTLAR